MCVIVGRALFLWFSVVDFVPFLHHISVRFVFVYVCVFIFLIFSIDIRFFSPLKFRISLVINSSVFGVVCLFSQPFFHTAFFLSFFNTYTSTQRRNAIEVSQFVLVKSVFIICWLLYLCHSKIICGPFSDNKRLFSSPFLLQPMVIWVVLFSVVIFIPFNNRQFIKIVQWLWLCGEMCRLRMKCCRSDHFVCALCFSFISMPVHSLISIKAYSKL